VNGVDRAKLGALCHCFGDACLDVFGSIARGERWPRKRCRSSLRTCSEAIAWLGDRGLVAGSCRPVRAPRRLSVTVRHCPCWSVARFSRKRSRFIARP